ncbi:LysR family transcriptional regulator [Limosilactobacillus panis]|uniref:LysR family transcriptional regulator n=1 Tax=Limosilactobacillus panis TaxID=47493 RepID=A0ABT7VN90_9LACO|nr:LysR family transcriptional regulator [Limosilactobacillus panis]MDM8334217.1 LysR family transcriptional regulator [Limosilactobacillus panis]
MIDNYLLEYLVTFAQTGTLAKTATHLNVTQPTVTRGMQRLEAEFGIALFDRRPNRITLTAAGQLAAQQAARLLQANRELVTTVRNYDQANRVIKVACSAPGPRIVVNRLAGHFPIPLRLTPQLIAPQQLRNRLLNRQLALIISNHEFQTDQVESVFIGQEHLNVNLDQFMYLANQQSVTFKELRGISFVVLNDIGPWKAIVQEQIPDAKFLYQTDYDALKELTKYTNFPFFTTNITAQHNSEDYRMVDRVSLPITDPAATMTFYATYLKDQRTFLRPLVQALGNDWPK